MLFDRSKGELSKPRGAVFSLQPQDAASKRGNPPEHENRHAQKKGMSVKTEVEAAVVSIRENPNDDGKGQLALGRQAPNIRFRPRKIGHGPEF